MLPGARLLLLPPPAAGLLAAAPWLPLLLLRLRGRGSRRGAARRGDPKAGARRTARAAPRRRGRGSGARLRAGGRSGPPPPAPGRCWPPQGRRELARGAERRGSPHAAPLRSGRGSGAAPRPWWGCWGLWDAQEAGGRRTARVAASRPLSGAGLQRQDDTAGLQSRWIWYGQREGPELDRMTSTVQSYRCREPWPQPRSLLFPARPAVKSRSLGIVGAAAEHRLTMLRVLALALPAALAAPWQSAIAGRRPSSSAAASGSSAPLQRRRLPPAAGRRLTCAAAASQDDDEGAAGFCMPAFVSADNTRSDCFTVLEVEVGDYPGERAWGLGLSAGVTVTRRGAPAGSRGGGSWLMSQRMLIPIPSPALLTPALLQACCAWSAGRSTGWTWWRKTRWSAPARTGWHTTPFGSPTAGVGAVGLRRGVGAVCFQRRPEAAWEHCSRAAKRGAWSVTPACAACLLCPRRPQAARRGGGAAGGARARLCHVRCAVQRCCAIVPPPPLLHAADARHRGG